MNHQSSEYAVSRAVVSITGQTDAAAYRRARDVYWGAKK